MATVPVLGALTQEYDGVIPYHAGRYDELRRSLVAHFTAQFLAGQLCWPRRFTADQRSRLPLTGVQRVLQRVVQLTVQSLYHKVSGLRRRNGMAGVGNMYTVPIGEGLFSHLRYLPGNVIVTFVGDEISADEGTRRTAAGEGKYMIKISAVLVMDCRPAFLRGECMASNANSPFGCWDMASRRYATKNSKLKLGRLPSGKWRAQLIATQTIEPDLEILYGYEREYVF
jgi:hypothetical protein